MISVDQQLSLVELIVRLKVVKATLCDLDATDKHHTTQITFFFFLSF